MNDYSNQYEVIKEIYLAHADKYFEAIRKFQLEHCKIPGIKSELAMLHHDMIMSCLPLYDLIAQIKTEF